MRKCGLQQRASTDIGAGFDRCPFLQVSSGKRGPRGRSEKVRLVSFPLSKDPQMWEKGLRPTQFPFHSLSCFLFQGLQSPTVGALKTCAVVPRKDSSELPWQVSRPWKALRETSWQFCHPVKGGLLRGMRPLQENQRNNIVCVCVCVCVCVFLGPGVEHTRIQARTHARAHGQ